VDQAVHLEGTHCKISIHEMVGYGSIRALGPNRSTGSVVGLSYHRDVPEIASVRSGGDVPSCKRLKGPDRLRNLIRKFDRVNARSKRRNP